ncbi:aminotransferase class IV [Streptomyces cinereospinus]|uniref:Aminotransferase class IV n=1 Tax=Streptomyces cinereospinus TaxID=285561 RepID=A0ABV5N7N4_9ACTN
MTGGAGAVAWVDGALQDEAAARPEAWSPSFHYGYGVFEGIRVYPTPRGPSAFRLAEHISRLFASARLYPPLDVIPWTEEDLRRAVVETVRASGHDACYVRPVIHLHAGGVGNDPTVGTARAIVLVTAWGGLLQAGDLQLTISPWRRPGPAILPPGAKANGSYGPLMLAKADAVRRGYDDALLLDEAGHVVESTGANLFVRIGDELISPGLPQGALPGITRSSVFSLAPAAGLRVTERSLRLDEVLGADELFLTGTGAEIRAVRSVEHKAIGNGTSPAADQLASRYQKVVRGLDPACGDWLTPCHPSSLNTGGAAS